MVKTKLPLSDTSILYKHTHNARSACTLCICKNACNYYNERNGARLLLAITLDLHGTRVDMDRAI